MKALFKKPLFYGAILLATSTLLGFHNNLSHKNDSRNNSFEGSPLDNTAMYCINNGSSKDANYIGQGTGGQLVIRFTESNWSGVRNTCGNYVPAHKNINGKRFTFPDPNLYQYQMVLFEQGAGVRNYFTGICEENQSYTIQTKKGFDYYVYTNDTDGDHEDNRGYISYCYLFR